MKYTLDTFERSVDNTILSRGKKYYKQGKVVDVCELDDEWICTVSGTDEYQVTITFDSSHQLDAVCNCPYDLGPVCKHIVASFFAVRDGMVEVKAKKKPAKAKRKTKHERQLESAQAVVDALHQEQLYNLIAGYAQKNSDFVRHILVQYGDETETLTHYRDQIKSDIRSATKRGFIDYWSADVAVTTADSLLIEAEKLYKRNI